MKVLIIGLVLFVGLFVIAVISPRASRRLQRSMDRNTRKAEARAYGRGGRAGRFTGKSLTRVRRGGDRSAQAGRAVHDQIAQKTRGER